MLNDTAAKIPQGSSFEEFQFKKASISYFGKLDGEKWDIERDEGYPFLGKIANKSKKVIFVDNSHKFSDIEGFTNFVKIKRK